MEEKVNDWVWGHSLAEVPSLSEYQSSSWLFGPYGHLSLSREQSNKITVHLAGDQKYFLLDLGSSWKSYLKVVIASVKFWASQERTFWWLLGMWQSSQ